MYFYEIYSTIYCCVRILRRCVGTAPSRAFAMASRKLSGLQLDILSLYRQLLRAARAKGPDTSMAVRTEFRRNVRGAFTPS